MKTKLSIIISLTIVLSGITSCDKLKQSPYIDNEKNIPNRSDEKNIPIKTETPLEKLQIMAIKTGFYEYKELTHYQLLYQPMVILKIKNISDKQLSENIKIKAVFISNDEEWGSTYEYFQSSSDNPLQSGLSRQIYLKTDVGWKSSWNIGNSDVKCQLYIENELFKTIKITNRLLSSNMIQVNDPYLDFDANNDVSNMRVEKDNLLIENNSFNEDNEEYTEHEYSYVPNHLLTENDLIGLSKSELRILRNEIYARHGYIFKSQDLRDYFSTKSWYSPRYDDVSSQLSTIEKKNVEFIKKHE